MSDGLAVTLTLLQCTTNGFCCLVSLTDVDFSFIVIRYLVWTHRLANFTILGAGCVSCILGKEERMGSGWQKLLQTTRAVKAQSTLLAAFIIIIAAVVVAC